jgi:tRNA (guanosine-2'-O-)-methyltransferase
VSRDALDALIDRHGADAVCAALAPMLTADRIARIDTALASRLASVAIVVEDTYDPHNAAATIRTAEALGIQDLHVVEVVHKFAIAHGVTRGAHDWLDLTRWPSMEAAAAQLHARGFRLLATAPDAPDDVEAVDVTSPIAIAFGNEHEGLSASARRACDGAIAVPMFGMTESYNLSVTVALAASRLAARRRAHLGCTGDLDPERRARLRAHWFGAKIRGAAGVVERLLEAADPAAPPRLP